MTFVAWNGTTYGGMLKAMRTRRLHYCLRKADMYCLIWYRELAREDLSKNFRNFLCRISTMIFAFLSSAHSEQKFARNAIHNTEHVYLISLIQFVIFIISFLFSHNDNLNLLRDKFASDFNSPKWEHCTPFILWGRKRRRGKIQWPIRLILIYPNKASNFIKMSTKRKGFQTRHKNVSGQYGAGTRK